MVKILNAIFDGVVLKPEELVDIIPNSRVKLSIEYPDRDIKKPVSFLKIARNLNLVGPKDWSERV